MARGILRPLSYSDLLDGIFDLYKSHFKLFAGIAAVLYVPINVIFAVTMSIALKPVMGMKQSDNIDPSVLPSMMGYWAIYMVVYGFATFMVNAATTYAVSKCYLDEQVTISDAYKAVGRRWLPLIMTGILGGLLILVGYILCIVPGVIVAFNLLLLPTVVIIDKLTYSDAIKRSFGLSKGHIVRIIVVTLLASIIAWCFSGALNTVSSFLPPASMVASVFRGLIESIALVIVGPLQVIAMVLLYYDIRVRKEGFDMELLSKSLSSSKYETPIN